MLSYLPMLFYRYGEDTAAYDFLRRIHAERGTSFVIVTHDARLGQRCDRLVARGKKLRPGSKN